MEFVKNVSISRNLIIIAGMSLVLAFVGCNSDNPPAPELPVVFLPDSLIVEEGNMNRNLLIDIRLTFPGFDTVTIEVSTVEGTAKATEDFVPLTNQRIQFEPGALRKTVSVSIVGDNLFEPDEWFMLKLSNVKNGIIEKDEMVIVLLNDDIDNTFRIPAIGATSPTSYPNMRLIWSDEFDRTEWDGTYWTHETGGGGWGNNELQFYRSNNTFFVDGHLVIEARRENFGGRAFTSSRIITMNKFDFQYGRVDIRASMPFGQGMWPALWMLGSNFPTVGWPRCGEIDIMEMIGGNNRERVVHGTAHWQHGPNKADFGGSFTVPEGNLHDRFHVYSIIWDQNSIRWLINDIQYHQMAITDPELSEFRAPFFFIFNVAVGGNWPGSPNTQTLFPQRMIVDYVRVFQTE